MGYFTEFDETVPCSTNYYFENSLINTVDTQDEFFVNIIYDRPDVPPFAKEHFVKIDNDVFDYDFHLMENSTARGAASDAFLDVLPYDLDGVVRGSEAIDAGCYQFVETIDE